MRPVLEFFSLSTARRRRDQVTVAVRTRLAAHVKQSRHLREAAKALWTSGCSAEALKMAYRSFELLADEVDRATLANDRGPISGRNTRAGAIEQDTPTFNAAPSSHAAPTNDELEANGPVSVIEVMPDSRANACRNSVHRIRTRMGTVGCPTFDDEIQDAHARFFQELLEERDRLAQQLGAMSMTDGEFHARRLWRVGCTLAVLALLTGLVVQIVKQRRMPKAEASASYPGYDPSRAVDGNLATEWLLPDRAVGSIDIILPRPRLIRRLKLVNALNRPYHNRSSQNFRVEVLRGGQVVKSVDGSFGAVNQATPPTYVDIHESKIERVRITINTYHLDGGGLAEVSFE